MPRLPAQWQSKKPGQPETISSERPKLLPLQPSEMSRSSGPLRHSHSKGNMATSCRIWKCKSSERRAEIKLASSLPARQLCTPAHRSSRAIWLLPITFYWGTYLHSSPFILLLRASQVEEQPPSAASPTPVPKQSPRPKRWHPSPDPVESTPLGRTTSKAPLGRLPSSKQ